MDTTRLDGIVPSLLLWFSETARELPWRSDPTAYHVWVSEIMLQQTRVEAVKPYYTRFMEALPDIQALAECEEERLLKLWEGLGYYNRARNMQKAAVKVLEQYGGELPSEYEELLTLPGIGRYTAGAVASIAYGRAAPAVDGNVLRVVSRICGNEEDIMKQSVRDFIEKELARILPAKAPGTFNQALMELGAVVCVPNGAPLCGSCPVREFCFAFETGRQQELPVRAAKKQRRIEERTVLVLRDGERTAIRKRPKRGLLAGMYELPNYPGLLSSDEALALVKTEGWSPIRVKKLGKAHHVFSHVEWRMEGYLILVEELAQEDRDGWLFIEPERAEREFPVPAAFSAYTKYLNIRLGQDKYKETV